MKAMIFAAGKGIRLKPLTDNTPKALVKINEIPMLEHVIIKLKNSGVSEIIINIHYLADQIIDFLKEKNNFGIRIEISDERNQLLDTGGGLKKASWFFDDNKPFIVHNVDVVSNIDLKQMIDYHMKTNALATLAVRNRNTSRYFLFNKENNLCGWENVIKSERIITKPAEKYNSLAFSGIHIINPEIFHYFKYDNAFSIVETYLELSKNQLIIAYNHSNDYWFDIGKPENLKLAEEYLKQF